MLYSHLMLWSKILCFAVLYMIQCYQIDIRNSLRGKKVYSKKPYPFNFSCKSQSDIIFPSTKKAYMEPSNSHHFHQSHDQKLVQLYKQILSEKLKEEQASYPAMAYPSQAAWTGGNDFNKPHLQYGQGAKKRLNQINQTIIRLLSIGLKKEVQPSINQFIVLLEKYQARMQQATIKQAKNAILYKDSTHKIFKGYGGNTEWGDGKDWKWAQNQVKHGENHLKWIRETKSILRIA